MHHVILELAFIRLSIFPLLDALSMLFAMLKSTIITVTCNLNQNTMTMPFIVNPVTLIPHTVKVSDNTVPMLPPVLELTDIQTSIQPCDCALPIGCSSLVNLTLVYSSIFVSFF